jgi:hypothetical protein
MPDGQSYRQLSCFNNNLHIILVQAYLKVELDGPAIDAFEVQLRKLCNISKVVHRIGT